MAESIYWFLTRYQTHTAYSAIPCPIQGSRCPICTPLSLVLLPSHQPSHWKQATRQHTPCGVLQLHEQRHTTATYREVIVLPKLKEPAFKKPCFCTEMTELMIFKFLTNLFYLLESEREKKRLFFYLLVHSPNAFSSWHGQGFCQPLEISPDLPHEWRGPNYYSHRPVPPRVHISRKLEPEAMPGPTQTLQHGL